MSTAVIPIPAQPTITLTRPSIIPTGGVGKAQTTLDPKAHSLVNLELIGDSASLPGGNEENRALEDELGAQRRKLLKCQTEVETLQQKTDTLWRHMNNIRIDVNENQVSFHKNKNENL